MEDIYKTINELDSAKKLTGKGKEYWMARDIHKILGYPDWANFESVIQRARMACESTGVDVDNHFHDTTKMVLIGSGTNRKIKDYFLTRYACYLIAMNGDSRKPEIGTAQSYFAVQARRQEKQDQLSEAERRFQLRERVKNANLSLASTAKKVGVQRYGLFQDAGYQGLYEMGLTAIKRRKKIDDKENLLDRAGRTELAANEFRITQTEEKLVRDGVHMERHAIDTHRNVGREVRNVIKKLGGTMPEDLPPEESIKKIIRKKPKEIEFKKEN